MHSACIKIRTLVSVLFVCRCYFFDLKISIKSNITCSIKLMLWCFKALPPCMLFGSFISLMADFFKTAHLEEPTYASCFMSPGVYTTL